jgi:hypothetical protein
VDQQPHEFSEGRDALTERLEALVRLSEPDDPEVAIGPMLAASLTGLRTEIDERLAVIEDSVDGLAERFEALARDSATDGAERIASLDDRVAALTASLQAERAAAAQHRERLTGAIQVQSGALDQWAEAVLGRLEDLGESMTDTVKGLSGTLSRTAAAGRETERGHLDALVAELSQTIEDGFLKLTEQLRAIRHAPGSPDRL